MLNPRKTLFLVGFTAERASWNGSRQLWLERRVEPELSIGGRPPFVSGPGAPDIHHPRQRWSSFL